MDAEKTTTYQLTAEEAAAVDAIRVLAARQRRRLHLQHLL